MNTLRTLLVLAIATFAAWILGCEDDTTKPPPPPKPPQVSIQTVRGLPNNDVFSVFVDSKRRQWFCTDSGIGMAEPNEVASVSKVFDDFDGVPNRKTRCAAELNGKIFVGTWGGGIGVADEETIENKTPTWTVLNMDSGLVANRVFDLAVDDSSLWIATVSGITQYIDDDSRPLEERWIDHSDLGTNVVSSIVFQVTPTRGPEVWMSEKIRDSLGVVVPGGIRVLGFPGHQNYTTETSGIPSDDCNEVTYDALNDRWVSVHSTRGIGIVDVDTRTWSYLTKTDGLNSDLGSSVAVNHTGRVWPEGTMWYATQAGLSRITPEGKIINYVEGSGLPSLNVRSVYVAPNDQVWVTFVEAGAGRVR